MIATMALRKPGAAVADDALRDLYRDHYRGLVRLATLLVDDRETAEEVVQDAFVKVHAGWHRIAEPDRALPYLRSAVLNGARSALRRRGVARRWFDRETRKGVADAPSAEAAGVAGATRDDVMDAIRHLPEQQRNVVLLRYYADLSEAQIAETLGIAPGTVKTSCHRALAKLAPMLEALQ